jgi:hypothetical protein
VIYRRNFVDDSRPSPYKTFPLKEKAMVKIAKKDFSN